MRKATPREQVTSGIEYKRFLGRGEWEEIEMPSLSDMLHLEFSIVNTSLANYFLERPRLLILNIASAFSRACRRLKQVLGCLHVRRK